MSNKPHHKHADIQYARFVKKMYCGKCCMYKLFSFLYTINGGMDLDKLTKKNTNMAPEGKTFLLRCRSNLSHTLREIIIQIEIKNCYTV